MYLNNNNYRNNNNSFRIIFVLIKIKIIYLYNNNYHNTNSSLRIFFVLIKIKTINIDLKNKDKFKLIKKKIIFYALIIVIEFKNNIIYLLVKY